MSSRSDNDPDKGTGHPEAGGGEADDFGLGSLFGENGEPTGPPTEAGSPEPEHPTADPDPEQPAVEAATADTPSDPDPETSEQDGEEEATLVAAAATDTDEAGTSDTDTDETDSRATARKLAEERADERRALKEERKEERRQKKEAKPRMRKLRFLAVLVFLIGLALVSWVFGVMMAVTSDLPDLEARAQYDDAQNSTVVDRYETKLVTLTGNERRVLIESEDISPLMKQAVVSIEDERFYEHRGIDYLGLARALREDILAGGAVQGGSTITQQFVKTALEAQQDRTILQKLKESALAYQIERQWSKDKILTNYLNNIYFGNGAYGIEAAAKTYFGANHPGCGTPERRCASELRVEEAAMLAAMIASPTAFDPVANPNDALERRNIVLGKMRELGEIVMDDQEFEDLKDISLPGQSTVSPPSEESSAPYFTEWLRQQIVDRYGPGQAFGGGLEVESTLDLDLQNSVQSAVQGRLSGLGPTGAAVVIENGTGKVRAMVGGVDYETSAFNAATNGFRQPGSSFKPFTLVTALSNGISADSTWNSQPVEIPFEAKVEKKNGQIKTVTDTFAPKNYDDSYLGTTTLANGTTYSDNSVYAQVGMQVGPKKIAATANEMGIDSDVGTNPAMILGGLETGVTPLEMAYAYSTLANGGDRVSGTMASRGIGEGPVGIESVKDGDGDLVEDNLGATGENEIINNQVVDPDIAQQAKDILHTVVTSGTGKNAQVGSDYIWGKTGTTDGNIDAWFVGANENVTVAVWIGYEDGATPMETEFAGAPVDGGTIPALLWSDIVAAYNELQAGREAAKAADGDSDATTTESAPVVPTESYVAPAPVEPAPVEPVPEVPVEPAPVEPVPEVGGAVPVE